MIMSEYMANNPYYLYLRAKCYYNLGPKMINKARIDIAACCKRLDKIHKDTAFVMRIRVEYMAALIEYDQGENLERALFHYNKFFEYCSMFSKPNLQKYLPEIGEMTSNANENNQ